ncbi:MAG: hypothetical protein A2X35_09920 [Elusimicrobia bacterium GWA2_61_42]|nr:MAG: hypothetical protein A2X35_09920 [Elusimicrobia bacterium GWA2_61_42]OGR74868.1 MAG: hypothetical protein A2X38_08835 [Elusimicrobia bacterium GWC2_61_25]
MRTRSNLIAAGFAALLALAPFGGRAPSLAQPAAAYSVNAWDIEEDAGENALARLLRAHGQLIFTGIGVVAFVVFSVMMGPLGRVPRRGFGGFGTNGGFGGNITMKNPWK